MHPYFNCEFYFSYNFSQEKYTLILLKYTYKYAIINLTISSIYVCNRMHYNYRTNYFRKTIICKFYYSFFIRLLLLLSSQSYEVSNVVIQLSIHHFYCRPGSHLLNDLKSLLIFIIFFCCFICMFIP